MASPTVDIGTGHTVVFATSGFSSEIVDLTYPGLSREWINSSHQGTTTAHAFIPADLFDPGEMTLTCHFNPDTDPPIDAAAETITITSPAGATWVFSGGMSGYDPGATLNDKMTVDVTVKVSGDITITGA
jgi:hypothetical protein